MKLISIFVLAAVMVGCGENDAFQAKTMDNTKKQQAEIEERISYFHPVLNVAGETQVAIADALPGEAKYAACGACHGSNGGGGVGPKLSGQTADYLTGRLNAYRAGEKVGSQSNLMWGNAAGLSDQDISELVEYILTF